MTARRADLSRFWPSWLPVELRERLERCYDDPSRGYHDLLHLSEVLANVDVLMSPGDAERDAVLLAAWFHDAVYRGRGDDEERSAELAESVLAGVAPEPLVAEVARLVRLTATHRPAADDRPGQALCDADLAILAAGAERYESYTRGVRSEYAQVPDIDFAADRAAVLRELLAKPALFETDEGRRRWEQRARANVAREIDLLSAPPLR
jgi:predicted metal-dependent HD superfamily phosphohydrolase